MLLVIYDVFHESSSIILAVTDPRRAEIDLLQKCLPTCTWYAVYVMKFLYLLFACVSPLFSLHIVQFFSYSKRHVAHRYTLIAKPGTCAFGRDMRER